MRLKVRKWGNSLAIRIPKDIASLSSIHLNTCIEVEVGDKYLVLKPVEEHQPALSDLIEKITHLNLHSEISSGEPQGNEIW
ncbi:MAG: AbrB/MazE/SpoVT family DNA-binding domain-containing protein [Candidatus Xenobiia bacterium LiM19]